jgi:hypothetical protein
VIVEFSDFSSSAAMTSSSPNHLSSSPSPFDEGDSSNKISQPVSPPVSQKKTVAEIIEETFPAFSPQSIVDPFEEERQRDIVFEKGDSPVNTRPLTMILHFRVVIVYAHPELTRMIIDVLIQCHAWSSARPRHERNMAAAKLEKNINAVLKVEQEQGMSPASSSYSIWLLVGRAIFRTCLLIFSLSNSFRLCGC